MTEADPVANSPLPMSSAVTKQTPLRRSSFPLAMESPDAGPLLPTLGQPLTQHPRGKTQLVFLVGDPKLSLQH